MTNLIKQQSRVSELLLASIILTSVSFSGASAASDISHKLRQSSEANSATENYFELGLGIATGIAPNLTEDEQTWTSGYLVVNGSYTWHNAFIEMYGESGDGLLLGYNAFTSDNWSLDLVVGPQFSGLDSDEKFAGLDDRDTSVMLGGRLTGYVGENVLQFTLKQDIAGKSKGMLATALVGRNWQVRNWNVHGLLGVQYFDSNINEYYLAVSEAEAARTQFTAYTPGSNINYTAEVGVTYPISENWVLRSTARFNTVSDADMNSPLFATTRSTRTSLSASVSYVF